MTVEVSEARLVVSLMGCFILATAVIAAEPLAHTILSRLIAVGFAGASIATLLEAAHPKND